MTLTCVFCLFVYPDDTGRHLPDIDGRAASDAVTVAGGWAVCDEHLGLVACGADFASTLAVAHKEAGA